MGINYFREPQRKELETSPYITKLSEKAITYSEEFKQHFMNELNAKKFKRIKTLIKQDNGLLNNGY